MKFPEAKNIATEEYGWKNLFYMVAIFLINLSAINPTKGTA